tara:strand:+ start:173 stop:610 length:438 start_codon:yes stop_codon:yes gene_type:complete
MALTHWKSATLFNFGSDFDRYFDNFWNNREDRLSNFTWSPAVDIKETKEAIEVSAELPGLNKEEIDVDVANGVLSIKGEKKYKKESEGENARRTERAYGSFSRAFTLPAEVESDAISAVYKDGVLSIKLPKSEAAKSKRIEVKAA